MLIKFYKRNSTFIYICLGIVFVLCTFNFWFALFKFFTFTLLLTILIGILTIWYKFVQLTVAVECPKCGHPDYVRKGEVKILYFTCKKCGEKFNSKSTN